jgi:hypothetical protein
MVREFGGELTEAGLDGDEIVAAAARHLPALESIAETIFGRWASPIQGT